jgi:hypothetical protein
MMAKEETSLSDQADRFRQAAREVRADESDDALDRVMGKLDLKKKPESDKAQGEAKQK